MTDINLDTSPSTTPRSRRARLVAVLTAPAPTAVVLVVAALAVVAARMPAPHPAAPVVHEVRATVSAYPAKATAFWRDHAGATHTLDPWADQPVRIPARAVVIAVAGDVDCSLIVDGTTVDTASGRDGAGVCTWVG